jgi:predicted outer membrane repeat protein
MGICTLNINNLNLINAKGISQGGAVSILAGNLIAANCNFNNNNAVREGGAVCAYNFTATNCDFNNNNADRSGAVDVMGDGNFIATGCNFNNNSSIGPGGAVSILVSNATLTDCNFNNNNSERYGGAINANGSSSANYKLTTINCNFTNNSAQPITMFGSNGCQGGAIYTAFVDYTATNCNFNNNEVYVPYNVSADGGALNLGSSATLTDCHFSNNTASRDGGAI